MPFFYTQSQFSTLERTDEMIYLSTVESAKAHHCCYLRLWIVGITFLALLFPLALFLFSFFLYHFRQSKFPTGS